jgi:hypothetical protein
MEFRTFKNALLIHVVLGLGSETVRNLAVSYSYSSVPFSPFIRDDPLACLL